MELADPGRRRRTMLERTKGMQNFASSSLRGTGYRSGVQDVVAGAEGDPGDVFGREVVPGHEFEHGGHARVAEASRGEGLHGHAGVEQGVGRAEGANQPLGLEAAAEHAEEAPRRLQRIVPGREAARREVDRHDAVLGGAPGVERLGHGAEPEPDPRREARRDAERHGEFVRLQPGQPGGRRAGPERADRRGRVEPFPVVPGIDRLGDLALHLEADEERLQELGARGSHPFPPPRTPPTAAPPWGA